MSAPHTSVTVARHAVPRGADGLSPLQRLILDDPAPVRVLSAPTGAGKSHAFITAAAQGARVLFVVPTRRLAQNLAQAAKEDMARMDPALADAVALWTSDETRRRRDADPSYRPWQARVRQVNNHEGERFLVATPESVAQMLLRHAPGGVGMDPFGPASLVQGFQHIVFDEFHSIDPRGFGLCAFVARLCAFAAEANPGVPDVPRATFLSATPVSIAPTLTALGVGAGSITVAAETVDDAPPPGTAPDRRVLHGDVRIAFVHEPDMPALLDAHAGDIRACIDGGRQLVVILDSMAELHAERARFAAFFDRLGIPPGRRLAINSVDDSATAGMDGLFTTDWAADPRGFDVLLATSSVEIGVTFRAGMLAMDPGHDALSFMQRVGRVARADEPGLVLVRHDPARDGKRPWLRALLPALAAEAGGPLPASCFNALVLGAVRQRFEADPASLRDDEPPATFRTMPQRAVWASCLFWHAMERNRPKHLAGQRQAFDAMRPGKVNYLAKLLQTAAGMDGPRPAHFGAEWAHRFLAEAGTLRDIAPSVTLQHDGRNAGKVPLHFLERFPALAAFPLVADDKGGWVLLLDRPFEAVLRDAKSVSAPRRRVVLLPDGQSRTFHAAEAADMAVSAMRRTLAEPGTGAAEAARLKAAIKLVELTRLVPGEDDVPAAGVGCL